MIYLHTIKLSLREAKKLPDIQGQLPHKTMWRSGQCMTRLLWWLSRLLSASVLRLVCHLLFFMPWQGGFTQIKCNTDIFIGGVPNYDDVKKNSGILHPFSGSIQKVSFCLLRLDISLAVHSDIIGVIFCASGRGFEKMPKCLRFYFFNTHSLVLQTPVPGFLLNTEWFYKVEVIFFSAEIPQIF